MGDATFGKVEDGAFICSRFCNMIGEFFRVLARSSTGVGGSSTETARSVLPVLTLVPDRLWGVNDDDDGDGD
jgi:hypothetical protein